MKACILLISGAVSPYLFEAALPAWSCLLMLLILAALAFKPAFRVACLFPAFFLLTTLFINHRMDQRLSDLANKSSYDVTGVIGSLPERRGDYLRFIFLPDSDAESIPPKLRVFWHSRNADETATALPAIHAGEHWRLQLELRTTRGRVNFSGIDSEKWLFAQGIAALGFVQPGNNMRLAGPDRLNLQAWRESVLERIRTVASGVPSLRLVAALAIADRREIRKTDRDILSATGTGHLLAISGLHIGLAAIMGFFLGRLGLLLLPCGLALKTALALPWATSWLAALTYSALAGFGVSTQRAMIMLSVATVVILSRRKIHPAQAWMFAMAVVLIVDPLAPLAAGFWFSFTAVAILLFLFSPRYGQIPAWKRMLLAQIGISLILAPLGMYLFQLASLPGLLANLVAIPLVSFLVVPLILVGMLLLWLPGSLIAWLFMSAGFTLQWLFSFLEGLSTLQPLALSTAHSPGLASTVLAMIGGVIIMLPRGIPLRSVGVLLFLPIFLPVPSSIASNETQTDVLDVGQGLSVLVGSHDYLLVYDTGPGNGLSDEAGWDMVTGTIQPMIAARGQLPDLIVASHADLDHAGGLGRLKRMYPQTGFLASLPHRQSGIDPCIGPFSWSVDNLDLRILHPSVGLPYLGNDSSCVMSVQGMGLNLLLSGDVGRRVEQRLVDNGLKQHAILTAPHHGSSTSSSQQLIDAVRPELVLISAAHNNRFGFPRADVISRYRNSRVRVLNTALCGGIRIKTKPDGSYTVKTARVARKAIWRWPAHEDCP